MAGQRDDRVPFRAVVLFSSLLVGLAVVGAFSIIFPAGDTSMAAELLVDRNTQLFPYPFTIQNVMWIAFCAAAGELLVRRRVALREGRQLDRELLPEGDETVLRRKDLAPVLRRIAQSDPQERHMLQRLLTGAIVQFRNSGSTDQASATVSLSLELFQNEVELRYNMIRYVIWLIPTLGFIGTVLGIAFALRTAGTMFATLSVTSGRMGPEMMERVTSDLGVAFYTTLLALLQSAVLMFAMHVLQEREEGVLNQVGQYSLRNLVNRLKED